jgi:hypothetical protein
VPLRRFAVIGAALIGEDGVRDVTIAPRNDAAAVAIGSKSWPFDIRLRPWVFRPHIGLLPLRYIATGDVRSFTTNALESGRFQGFLTGNMSDQVITVRCGIFLVITLRCGKGRRTVRRFAARIPRSLNFRMIGRTSAANCAARAFEELRRCPRQIVQCYQRLDKRE